MSKNKRQHRSVNSMAGDMSSKRVKQSDDDAVDDRISSLPDCVIHQILSLLPTKDAVKTSFLSKSWAEHWKFVPKLEFIACGFESKFDLFKDFVYKVLYFNKASVLKRFSINLGTYLDCPAIRNWTMIALDRGVKEIDITSVLAMPSCLFRAEALVFLRLESCKLDVPSSAHLPSLKILHLIHTEYSNVGSFTRLMAGCSVLEDLLVRRQKGLSYDFVVSSHTLKRLDFSSFDVTFDENGEDTYFTNTLWLDAPSLKYLILTDWRTGLHPDSNVGELLEARIEASYCQLGYYLKPIYKVRRLSLNAVDRTKSCPPWCGARPRTFDCLHHLKISVDPRHRNKVGTLLRLFPKIQFLDLELNKMNSDPSLVELLNEELQVDTASLHPSLKRIAYRASSGRRYEYILTNLVIASNGWMTVSAKLAK